MARTVDTLAEEAAVRLGEPIVAAQQFYARDRWKTGSTSWSRLARVLLGRTRLDDRLGQLNLLAVTASNVVVFGVEISRGGTELSAPLGTWPRSVVTATTERVELATGGSGTNQSTAMRRHHQKFLRLTLQTPDGELGADLPVGERRSQQLANELSR